MLKNNNKLKNLQSHVFIEFSPVAVAIGDFKK